MIVLDTNVLSEAVRPQPDEAVMRWLRFAPGDDLFTTTITEAEMRYGAARLPAGRNRKEREAQIDRIFTVRFARCVLPFDTRAAQVFPNVILSMQKQGGAIPFLTRKSRRLLLRMALQLLHAMWRTSNIPA